MARMDNPLNIPWLQAQPQRHPLLVQLEPRCRDRECNDPMCQTQGCRKPGAHPQVLERPRFERDAGFDLVVSQTTQCPPGKITMVPSDVRLQLPEGLWYLILGRSSTATQRGLVVIPSVIDGGYRGPLATVVLNPGTDTVTVKVGERVGQVVPMPLVAPALQPQQVRQVDPGDRGDLGYGSTGT